MFCTYGQESPEFINHIVKKGENVYRLSLRYKVPVDSIKQWNYLDSNYLVIEGMYLIIRRPLSKPQEKLSRDYVNKLQNVADSLTGNKYHIVGVKENVFRISLRYHVHVDSISIWNNLDSNFTIIVGQRLIVSGRKSATNAADFNIRKKLSPADKRISEEQQTSTPKLPLEDTLTPKIGLVQLPDTSHYPEKTPVKDSLLIVSQPTFLPMYSGSVEKEIKSTFLEKVLYYYHKSSYLFRIIFFLDVFFIISVFILSIVLLSRRLHEGYVEFIRNKCQDRYRNFITGWLYEEHNGSVPQSLLKELNKRVYREVFTSNLLSLHANLTGESAEKLVELFHLAGLKKYSIKKVKNSLWHVKAMGFREIAQMKIKGGNNLIYNYLNSINEILRIEAQSAWIQLNPEDPLNFYNDFNAQITEWGQLNLLRSLKKGGKIPNFGRWLKSESRSVAVFALKMSGIFKQLDNVDLVTNRLDDTVPEIIYEAICTLGKMALPSPVYKLQQLYQEEGLVNKTEIVRSLTLISDSSNVPFFEKVLLNETDIKLRILAAKGLILLNEIGTERLDSLYLDADTRLKEIIIHAKDNRI